MNTLGHFADRLTHLLVSLRANRSFFGLWLAQAVTQTAQNAVNFALLVLAQQLTGSSAQVGLIILSFSLPAVLFSTLAGVLVDRWDKKLVLVVSTLVRGGAVASYFVATSAADMPWVYLASFVFATAGQFFAPAQGAVIPKMVGEGRLIAANSLFNLTNMASQFLGFTVIGWAIIRSLGLRNGFVLVFLVYLASAVLIALIDIPKMRVAHHEGSPLAQIWTELLEGWRYIARRRVLVATIGHLSIANTMYLMLGTLGPAFVLLVLHVRAEDLGVLLVPAGVATLLGAVAVSKLARPDNRHEMVHGGLIGVGLSVLGLALIAPVARTVEMLTPLTVSTTGVTVLAIGWSIVFGCSAAFVAIPAQTVLQENSSDEVRGRVLSIFFMASNAAAFFPILLAGAVADRLGVLQTMTLVGLLIVGVGVGSQWVFARAGNSWDRREVAVR